MTGFLTVFISEKKKKCVVKLNEDVEYFSLMCCHFLHFLLALAVVRMKMDRVFETVSDSVSFSEAVSFRCGLFGRFKVEDDTQ